MNPSPLYSPHLSPLSGIRPLSQTDQDSVTWVGGLAADFANRIVGYISAFAPSVLAVAAVVLGVALFIAVARFLVNKF